MFKKTLKNRVEIEMEEILLDKKAAAKLEIPIKQTGILAVFVIATLILILFLTRAFWLQIWQNSYYTVKANQNSMRFYSSQAPRGIIYDRSHKIIASNVPDFSLLVIPTDLPKDGGQMNKWIQELANILKKNDSEIADFIKNLNRNSVQPIAFNDLYLNQATLIELETRLSNLPGLFIDKETKRDYPEGSYFAHLVGYTRKVSGDDLKKDTYYSPLDFIGKAGLEVQYEKDLRGIPGKMAVVVNSNNTALKTLAAVEAKSGNDLVLNIDYDLQKITADALISKMAQTNAPGAAAVVLNVKSGAILSLVSLPSYDNNIFNNNLASKTYKEFINNKNRPLFNRVISSFYPAGSTIKPFIASAALAENTIDPNYKIDDTLGYISIQNAYDPSVIYTYRDWRPHGFIDMREALAYSANVYFYEIGGGYKNIKGLGIDRIEKYLKIFGFGSTLGIDVPGEADGLVPNTEWKKKTRNENWFTGDTYNVSIGQGDVKITPLQLVAAMAAIANGGTLWKPTLASKVIDSSGNIIKEFKPETIRENLIGNDKLQIIREGLRKAVTDPRGSSFVLNTLPIEAAGKTGTAQILSDFTKLNALFTGFAPYNDPQIAIAVVVEGSGQGITSALPIAQEIFQWYYNQNRANINK